MGGPDDFDRATFARLQQQLVPMWPSMGFRPGGHERTLLIVSSVSINLPAHFTPLLPAYEERYLYQVMVSAIDDRSRAVYVTSQPVLGRMVDYYLGLMPGVDSTAVRSRIATLTVSDWSPRPLTQKILDRPRVVERIRSHLPNPERSVLMPFVTTPLEARLGVELGIPVYGPHPDLSHLGTKTGSRQVFAAAGVPHPRGAEGLRSVADLVEALAPMMADHPPAEVVVKLDDAVSGMGNAIVDLRGAEERAELEHRVRSLRPEDDSLDAEGFLDLFAEAGGIVEERITGEDFCSPSVQLRASPLGGCEVLSTHDQLLGGPSGQVYFGCRFPADPGYAEQLSAHGRQVGEELSLRGVVGRFAIDFVAVRRDGGWCPYAVEINLRNGGTTHPTLAMLALTNGTYDEDRAEFVAGGRAKYYLATDHLELPGLSCLTPDDVLDLIEAHGLGWDPETLTGPVFHMLSAVAVAGRLGVTAIADSRADAEALYTRIVSTLAGAI
jgi:hypothetical protein